MASETYKIHGLRLGIAHRFHMKFTLEDQSFYHAYIINSKGEFSVVSSDKVVQAKFERIKGKHFWNRPYFRLVSASNNIHFHCKGFSWECTNGTHGFRFKQYKKSQVAGGINIQLDSEQLCATVPIENNYFPNDTPACVGFLYLIYIGYVRMNEAS